MPTRTLTSGWIRTYGWYQTFYAATTYVGRSRKVLGWHDPPPHSRIYAFMKVWLSEKIWIPLVIIHFFGGMFPNNNHPFGASPMAPWLWKASSQESQDGINTVGFCVNLPRDTACFMSPWKGVKGHLFRAKRRTGANNIGYSGNMCLYIYIYMYICIYVYMYIYIHAVLCSDCM